MTDSGGAPSTDDLDPERLRLDLAEAREQLAASSEILAALGRSASTTDNVLDALVDSARRVCHGDVSQIHRVDGDIYRLARSSGLSEEAVDYLTHNPVKADRGSLVGRVGLDRRAQQITDVLSDPEYRRQEAQRVAGFRTIVGAPMLFDDEVIGVLQVWRTDVRPFVERETALLTTFAAQAAVAIRTMDLVRDLELRSTELSRRVDQLEALGAVGEAVNSSLDLDEVLSTIVMQAVLMSGTDGGSIMEFDDEQQEFHVRAAYGTTEDLLYQLRHTRIDLHTALVGRAATEGRPLAVPDLGATRRDAHQERLYQAGWRSILALPMLREGRIVGALVVRRKTTGGYSQEVAELLQTFASQSALAILNARLYRELERKSAELEVASRHKSEFLASMSHELRTPLNAVIGFSEVLLERMFGDINERQEDYLRDILNSGRHLLELLNDILDLSKVEAGRMELDRSTFSVRDAIDYALSMVREHATQHDISVVCEVGPEVGVVNADVLRFRQVVVNLLSNAVKFSADGGVVTVRANSDGAEVAVTVTDEGIGIPAEDRDRIFESFQQGSRALRQHEGTGLGLTLTKRIVDLHGGRMWLTSAVGVGSTFGFAIPIGAEAEESGRTSEAMAAGSVVVIVEDDRRSLDLLMLHLEHTGIDIIGVATAEDGLAVVRRVHPAAIILDIGLPGMNGWELMETLKADPATAALPIVVVSVLDDRAKGLALGAASYLVKPVSREDLLSALRQVHVVSGTIAATPVDSGEKAGTP